MNGERMNFPRDVSNAAEFHFARGLANQAVRWPLTHEPMGLHDVTLCQATLWDSFLITL